MKLLLKKIAVYLVLLAIILALFAAAAAGLSRRILDTLSGQVKPGVVTVIAGDSHTETSLDPRYIPGSINVSSSGENYFYIYYKLKYLLENNPQKIKNLVLAFSYHNLAKPYQELFLYEKARSASAFENYYILLDDEGKQKIESSPNYRTFFLKYDLGLPLQLHRDYYKYKAVVSKMLTGSYDEKAFAVSGGFLDRYNTKLNNKEIAGKIKLYYFDDNSRPCTVSETMVNYLEKILALCDKNGISVYLYNSPLYVSGRAQIPPSAIRDFNEVRLRVTSRHPAVRYLDFTEYPLVPANFCDGDHLNSYGAREVSGAVAGSIAR